MCQLQEAKASQEEGPVTVPTTVHPREAKLGDIKPLVALKEKSDSNSKGRV